MLTVVILAAGKGTRMLSSKPKVLFDLAGKKMIDYSINLALSLKPKKVIVVLGDKAEEVEKYISKYKVEIVIQKAQLGTADAVKTALPKIVAGSKVLILAGDMPLIDKELLTTFIKETTKDVSFISTKVETPDGYGRVLRDSKLDVISIVEEKDCNQNEKNIKEINSGIYLSTVSKLKVLLKDIKPNNSQKEYYLTDIITHGSGSFISKDSDKFLGINSREQLSVVSKIIWMQRAKYHLNNGVDIVDPSNCYLDDDIVIGSDTVIFPNVTIKSGSKIGKSCMIYNNTVIESSIISDNVEIKYGSVIEGSNIGSKSIVGPMARLRHGTVLKGLNKIGNFVEVKESELGLGSQASHLSYIGDATIGKDVNIGCGFITCNYDGIDKHKTIVGNNVFIGSDVQLVAPIKVGNDVLIGAGSTIVKDISSSDLAVSRSEQKNLKGSGLKYLLKTKKKKR